MCPHRFSCLPSRIPGIALPQPVYATRFITTDSVEEKMHQLQEKKQLVFDGTMDGSSASLARLTAEDLAFLFHS